MNKPKSSTPRKKTPAAPIQPGESSTQPFSVGLGMQFESIGSLLKYYLISNCNLPISWSASLGADVLKRCTEAPPSILIASPQFPDASGAAIVRAIRETIPETRIILYSATIHPQIVAEMMDAQVHSIVAARSPLSALLTAIEVVKSGGCFFDSVAEPVIHRRRTTTSKLTPRERTVLRLIAEGQSTKEIAGHLSLSVKTIEKFREHLMGKLEIHDAVRLTRFALRTGVASLN